MPQQSNIYILLVWGYCVPLRECSEKSPCFGWHIPGIALFYLVSTFEKVFYGAIFHNCALPITPKVIALPFSLAKMIRALSAQHGKACG